MTAILPVVTISYLLGLLTSVVQPVFYILGILCFIKYLKKSDR